MKGPDLFRTIPFIPFTSYIPGAVKRCIWPFHGIRFMLDRTLKYRVFFIVEMHTLFWVLSKI